MTSVDFPLSTDAILQNPSVISLLVVFSFPSIRNFIDSRSGQRNLRTLKIHLTVVIFPYPLCNFGYKFLSTHRREFVKLHLIHVGETLTLVLTVDKTLFIIHFPVPSRTHMYTYVCVCTLLQLLSLIHISYIIESWFS